MNRLIRIMFSLIFIIIGISSLLMFKNDYQFESNKLQVLNVLSKQDVAKKTNLVTNRLNLVTVSANDRASANTRTLAWNSAESNANFSHQVAALDITDLKNFDINAIAQSFVTVSFNIDFHTDTGEQNTFAATKDFRFDTPLNLYEYKLQTNGDYVTAKFSGVLSKVQKENRTYLDLTTTVNMYCYNGGNGNFAQGSRGNFVITFNDGLIYYPAWNYTINDFAKVSVTLDYDDENFDTLDKVLNQIKLEIERLEQWTLIYKEDWDFDLIDEQIINKALRFEDSNNQSFNLKIRGTGNGLLIGELQVGVTINKLKDLAKLISGDNAVLNIYAKTIPELKDLLAKELVKKEEANNLLSDEYNFVVDDALITSLVVGLDNQVKESTLKLSPIAHESINEGTVQVINHFINPDNGEIDLSTNENFKNFVFLIDENHLNVTDFTTLVAETMNSNLRSNSKNINALNSTLAFKVDFDFENLDKALQAARQNLNEEQTVRMIGLNTFVFNSCNIKFKAILTDDSKDDSLVSDTTNPKTVSNQDQRTSKNMALWKIVTFSVAGVFAISLIGVLICYFVKKHNLKRIKK